jgi:hypothetical protein
MGYLLQVFHESQACHQGKVKPRLQQPGWKSAPASAKLRL